MAITYFCSEEIAEKSWMIKNVGGSTPAICYLVEGADYALLIDSIIGIGNLKAYCENLTDKPIKVVNTHAHSDHIGGNFHFDHCYLHHRDVGFFQECVGISKEKVFEFAKNVAPEELRGQMVLDDNFADWNPIKIFPLYDGDEFDLGDRKIEVVYVGGHTAGSIALIDHKTRICYSGDCCNGNTLLEFENSLPIVAYLKNLLHLKEHQAEFDQMYGGHEIFDQTIIDEAIETVARVIAGTDDKYEETGMMETPVYYAAAKKKGEYGRVDGKRFNMSYVPENVYGPEETKQVIKLQYQEEKTFPDRDEAERLLKEAEELNPGPWGNHSRTAAHCAEKIALYSGMDPEKAYVLGLLHDIGRRFGKRHLGHVSDGYSYMTSLGYSDVARICLTHSFNQNKLEAYVGNFDTSEEETNLIRTKLQEVQMDDYDKLIQLCDSISGAEGVMDIIDRMSDVKQRYGNYDPEKWNANLALKDYFEQKMGKDLYEAVDKDHFRP